MPTATEVGRYLQVLEVRISRTARALRDARATLEHADAEEAACRRCVHAERTRLAELIDYLDSHDRARCPVRYAAVLERRDAVVVRLQREEFTLERARNDRRDATERMSARRSALATLRERRRQLADRLGKLERDARETDAEAQELELEELANTRYAHAPL